MPKETQDFEEGYKSCLARLGHSPEDADKEYQNYMDTVVTKEVILGVVSDLVTNFLYYDRKDDECLPRGAIEGAIFLGAIKPEEIVDAFAQAFYKGVE